MQPLKAEMLQLDSLTRFCVVMMLHATPISPTTLVFPAFPTSLASPPLNTVILLLSHTLLLLNPPFFGRHRTVHRTCRRTEWIHRRDRFRAGSG